MEETKNIREELRELTAVLKDKEKPKEKKFRLPFRGKVRPKKASKGYVTIIKINENAFMDITKERIEEQTTMIDGVPRLASPEHVLHWKKNPVIIQPSWSVEPYSPADAYKKSLNDGSNTKGYKLLMSRMKTEITSGKQQMGGIVKWIIGLGLLAVIGYAFMTGGG